MRATISFLLTLGIVSALSYFFGYGQLILYEGRDLMAFTQIRSGWFMLFAAIVCSGTWLWDKRQDVKTNKKLWAAAAGFLIGILILYYAMVGG